ncbi:MAG: cytochrome b/b6 domain-containing protein [Candidatus Binatia bacterium]
MKAEPKRAELIYRHNRVTRFTHWLNALALLILFMSGLQIFNAHPRLYWGSTSEPDTAFFSIGAINDDGEPRGFVQLYGRQFDTTGYLGVQPGELAPTVRAFPSWATIPGYYSLADARRWHFFFGWLFAINGLLYVSYNLAVGHMRKFFFTFNDARQVPAMIARYLRFRKTSPQCGEYNPLQKLAYTGVFVILTPLILLSGMAMSPQLNVAFHWLPAVFGGRQSARAIHFILTFAFLLFAFGHVFMVLTQGFFNNMRSMITGWYREKISTSNEPTRAPPEPKPDIAKALREEAPPPREETPTPPATKEPAAPSIESSPDAPSTPQKEVEKDAEPKS